MVGSASVEVTDIQHPTCPGVEGHQARVGATSDRNQHFILDDPAAVPGQIQTRGTRNMYLWVTLNRTEDRSRELIETRPSSLAQFVSGRSLLQVTKYSPVDKDFNLSLFFLMG